MAKVRICGRPLDIVSVLSSMLYKASIIAEKALDNDTVTVVRFVDTLAGKPSASFRCRGDCCVELDLEKRIRRLRDHWRAGSHG